LTNNSPTKSLRHFALFFFFAFLDERLAMEVADRAVTSYRSKTKSLDQNSTEARKILIKICAELWKSNKKRIVHGRPSSQLNDFGHLPAGADQTAWVRFHKDAAEEELLAILFSQVLGLPAQDISEALKISTGTLRHRIGRGIRMLGEYVGPTL